MFEIGDHVQQRDRVGNRGLTGVVKKISHGLLTIEWEDGHVSSLIPGPGALSILTPGRSGSGKS